VWRDAIGGDVTIRAPSLVVATGVAEAGGWYELSGMQGEASGPTEFRATWTPAASAIEVVGEIDIATAPKLAEAIEGALAQGLRPIRLDMRAVTFIDASVLGLFVRVQKRYERTDGAPVVEVVAGPFVERVIRLAEMERFLAR
jgi:anti-sigma B factor antagonist